MDNDRKIYKAVPIDISTDNMLTVNSNEAEYRIQAFKYMAIINATIRKLKDLNDKYWVNVLATDVSDMRLDHLPGFQYNYPFKCPIEELKPSWGEYPCIAEEDNNEWFPTYNSQDESINA